MKKDYAGFVFQQPQSYRRRVLPMIVAYKSMNS